MNYQRRQAINDDRPCPASQRSISKLGCLGPTYKIVGQAKRAGMVIFIFGVLIGNFIFPKPACAEVPIQLNLMSADLKPASDILLLLFDSKNNLVASMNTNNIGAVNLSLNPGIYKVVTPLGKSDNAPQEIIVASNKAGHIYSLVYSPQTLPGYYDLAGKAMQAAFSALFGVAGGFVTYCVTYYLVRRKKQNESRKFLKKSITETLKPTIEQTIENIRDALNDKGKTRMNFKKIESKIKTPLLSSRDFVNTLKTMHGNQLIEIMPDYFIQLQKIYSQLETLNSLIGGGDPGWLADDELIVSRQLTELENYLSAVKLP